ncbi:2-methoxy-6-polyprenyl-1,4-benzoquinol methylase, mitochondrial [Periophthalmus magnuspinnatus]|uniref:2-methoxy-6-polyprenyl-1,4-benzoquinol methylase, mitochondrial n=1 Tax=Periophthalmus magnuspinnatus TaxID=409849 RepID=A0A3B4BDF6_9GOBI|nr:2-methoxy-6-polyprenyl-1,4-benzoquinol methylase, mitochondrial [Periophthalmus magnuspinnatus]
MAASIKLFARRILRDFSRNVYVSASGVSTGSTHCRAAQSCRCLSHEAGDRSTHFGFETVLEEEKAKKVYQVFENVAQKYDVMNDAMSLGIHRLWKDVLLHAMNPQPGARLLDVAGGTGDIAFRFLEYIKSQEEKMRRREARAMQTPSWQEISTKYSEEQGAEPQESRAVVCDINKEMLKVGKQKGDSMGITSGLSWVVGDAEELPFGDDEFDIYTIAFGIRNVTHIEQALQEAQRVLKPGGRFMCLEFSKVSNPILSKIYDTYSFQVIPVLGEVIAGDWKSYQYLVESIRRFPDQGDFQTMIEDAGFYCVNYHNLTGGIVALHSGFKL